MNSTTTRVLSALVLIPLVLGMIWYAPPIVLRGFIVVIFVVAANELRSFNLPWPQHLALILPWLLFPLSLMSVLRDQYGPGVFMVMVATLIASDSGQYFAGRAFGRHKLAPVISPKKTVEGAIGGLVIAAVVAAVVGRWWLPMATDLQNGAAGLAMAVAGIGGDLFESALKRKAGVKDSGKLIPGHGGILDRIDSWLFAAPVFWLFLKFFTGAPA